MIWSILLGVMSVATVSSSNLAPPASAKLAQLSASQEDQTATERALDLRPNDPDLLLAAMESAIEEGDTDRALWYASLSLKHSPGAKQDQARDKRATAFLASAAKQAPLPEDLQAAYASSLLKLAKSAENKKFYVNAVDLLGRCMGTPLEERATDRLEKIFSKDKAVTALLASGVDVPISPRRGLRPSEIARFDAKYANWPEPAEFKGKFYTVRTDMGYTYGTAFLEAMEQMNSFYRQVFNYKTRGQTMRRCVLHVYGSRAVFEEQEPAMRGKATTRGFFAPGENRVAAYDRRTDGGTIEDLWSTLFHEASHQFTRAVWPGLIPTWLNEGTASYFEGAVLHPGGRVEKNRVPLRRLSSLVKLIRAERVQLKDVVTYFRPGSYPGEYYPYGWGLVYFCHNYENDQAERPYLSVYQDFMASYTGAAKHDVFGRFVEYFVTRAKIDGITTFEEFEASWTAWIQDLAKVTFGGPEQAEVLLEQSHLQLSFGKTEAAADTARRALDKRPGDIQALALLAEALVKLERDDGALLAWRQLEARAAELLPVDPERGTQMRERALAGMHQVDKNWTNAFEDGEQKLIADALQGADAWVEAGSPRTALELLKSASQILGKPSHLSERSTIIETEHGVSIQRWQHFAFGEGLLEWRADPGWEVQDGTLISTTDDTQACLWGAETPAPFQLAIEAVMPVDTKGRKLGLIFGGEFGQLPQAFVVDLESKRVGVLDITSGAPVIALRQAVPIEGETLSLLVVADGQAATFFVNGVEAATERVSAGARTPGGTVGILATGSGLRVKSCRIHP